MSPLMQFETLLIVIGAALLGSIIGFEREIRRKPAGLRTHGLVAASSALLVLLGPELVDLYAKDKPAEALRIDPISILQAIIVGISFIGAGTVLKDPEGKTVHNLTTAASILFAATIGIGVATGLYYLAVGAVLSLLLINLIFERIEIKMGTAGD